LESAEGDGPDVTVTVGDGLVIAQGVATPVFDTATAWMGESVGGDVVGDSVVFFRVIQDSTVGLGATVEDGSGRFGCSTLVSGNRKKKVTNQTANPPVAVMASPGTQFRA